MKYFVFLLLFGFFSTSIFAQSNIKYEMTGLIKLKSTDRDGYTYSIEFFIEKDSVKGYSLTNIGSPEEIKSTLVGKINGNKIFLVEKDVVYAPPGANSFCYFEINGTIDADRISINGDFKSFQDRYPHELCNTGYVSLTSKIKIPQTVEDKESPKIKIDTVKFNKEFLTIKDKVKLTKDARFTFYTTDQQVKLSLWDKNDLDGDVISVEYDGNEILKNYRLDAKPLELNLNISDATQTLIIKAENEGAIEPNTTGLKLQDVNREQSMQLDFHPQEQVEIEIKKMGAEE